MNKQLQWKTIFSSDQTPSARWGHASFVYESYFYIMGGYADSKYMNDLWRFDFNLNQWSKCEILGPLPQARSNHTLIWHEDSKQAILFGGGGVSKARFSDVWTLDIQKMRWNQMIPLGDGPQPRTYHCATIFLDHLFIYGGENGQDLSDIHALDLQNKCWVQIKIIKTDDQPQTRRFASLNAIGENQLLLVGGCLPNYTPTPQIYLAQITINENITLKWVKTTSELARWGHATIQKDKKVWLCGGRAQDEDIMEVVSIRTENDEVFLKEYISLNQIQPRRKQCFSVLGDSAVVFGGFNGEYLNDFNYFELPNGFLLDQNETREKIFSRLFRHGEFHDVTFIVKDKQIMAHKFVLITNLTYLNACPDILEQISKSDRISVDQDTTLFEKTLEFIYTSTFKNQQDKALIQRNLESLFKVKNLEEAFPLTNLLQTVYKKLNIINKYDILVSTQGGNQFQCHKAIMALQSGFFKGLLAHDFKDSEKNTIELNFISPEQFKPIYIFLYTTIWDQQITDIYQLFQLLRITQYLDIPTCTNKILYSIQMNLNENNIFLALTLSSQFDDEIIQNICSEKQIEFELNSNILVDRTNYSESVNEKIETARKQKIVSFSQKNIKKINQQKKGSNKENQV